MNGSGCKNCPVNPCETTNYRGSICAAQRAKFGLGDPQTNADRIRAMSDEELAIKLYELSNCEMQDCKECLLFKVECGSAKDILEWLKQTAE